MPAPHIAIYAPDGDAASASELVTSCGGVPVTCTSLEAYVAADGMWVSASTPPAQWMEDLVARRVAQAVERRLAGGRHVLISGAAFLTLFTGDAEDLPSDALAQWPGASAPVVGTPARVRVQAGSGSDYAEALGRGDANLVAERAILDWSWPDPHNPVFRAPIPSWTEPAAERPPMLAMMENGPLVGAHFAPQASGEMGAALFASWVHRCGS